MSNFKAKLFEERQAEASRIRAKYPDRIPIIASKSSNSKNIPDIDKSKYLVPAELTMGQFVYVLRKRIHLKPDQAIFIFVNNTLPHASALVSSIYEQHKDEDGFLYVEYAGENVFG